LRGISQAPSTFQEDVDFTVVVPGGTISAKQTNRNSKI
jgi:hypothetical protein